MHFTGLTTIDHAPQRLAEWLNQLQDDLGWQDHRRAYLLLGQTLQCAARLAGTRRGGGSSRAIAGACAGNILRRLGSDAHTRASADHGGLP